VGQCKCLCTASRCALERAELLVRFAVPCRPDTRFFPVCVPSSSKPSLPYRFFFVAPRHRSYHPLWVHSFTHPHPPPFLPVRFFFLRQSCLLIVITPESELDYSVFLAESPRERWGTIESRVDSPAADPRFSSSRPTTPATRSWPIHPSLFNTTTSALRSTLGVGSDGERSPSPPLAPSAAPIRRGVPIAELVDEENSAPGTRGGINSSRPAETFMNMSSAHSYPPLVISIVDVTPRPTGVSGNGVRRMRDER